MDTSEFRKPRADYPIYPSSAILRQRVKGFKVPKRRKGKKPRGKAVRDPIIQQQAFPKPPDRYLQSKTRDIQENARDRRERLRLEQDIAKDTIRYREQKAEAEERARAVRLIEGRRTNARNDRLIEDQARHFTDLLDRGERRAGEVQAQYQDFVRQMISVRNIPDRDVEIKFKPAGGSLFEEVREEEEVGGLRKPEVVKPSSLVQQALASSGLDISAIASGLEAGSPPSGLTLEELTPTPRKGKATPRQTADASERAREESQRKVEALASPTLRKAVVDLKETLSNPPEKTGLKPPAPEPEPEPELTGGGKAKAKVKAVSKKLGQKVKKKKTKEEEEEESRRLFLTTAPELYDAQQGARVRSAPQTKEQIELSDEYIALIGVKDKQVSYDGISKLLGDTSQQMKDADKDIYVRINEGFSSVGAGKQAGIFKVRQLPPKQDAEGFEDRSVNYTKFIFEDPFGRRDIATLNPYRIIRGTNELDKAVADGKIQFFVKDKEEEAQP